MFASPIVVVEHGLIRNARDFPDTPSTPTEVIVSDTTFGHLRSLAADTDGADTLLTVFWQRGRETIRVRDYVGLIGLPDGTQLEILPKIDFFQSEGAPAGRSVLLNMLRQAGHSPFQTLTAARTSATHLPLWAVFVTAFLDVLEPLIRQGLQGTYMPVNGNERFVRGKVQVARQQRENAHRADRLAVVYEELTVDCPPNRILKTTLLRLQRLPLSLSNQQRIRQFLGILEAVPAAESIPTDLDKVSCSNRLFRAYAPALQWAGVLLNGQAFGVKAGSFQTLSLLFAMPYVFERYVAQAVRRYWPAGVVTVQESSAHLVDEHGGAPKFGLRPDLLIRQNGQTFVLDTKWKHIDGTGAGAAPAAGNYGIEQADLYQLYAYGKKYRADNLFLIYPANQTFRQPLSVFGYDATTRLHVMPFDVTGAPADEVEKLAHYALSFHV